MSLNNSALFDSAVAGIAASNGAWLTAPSPTAYGSEANAAVAIATEIDLAIAPITPAVSESQRSLMLSITKSVMAGRSPESTAPSDYASIAQAIAGIFTEFNLKLQNTDSVGIANFIQTLSNLVNVSLSAPPEIGDVLTASETNTAVWHKPNAPFPHLTSEYLDLLFDLTDESTMVLTSLTGGNSVPGSWTLSGFTAVNSKTNGNGLPIASELTETGTSARSATWSVSNNIGSGTVRCEILVLTWRTISESEILRRCQLRK